MEITSHFWSLMCGEEYQENYMKMNIKNDSDFKVGGLETLPKA